MRVSVRVRDAREGEGEGAVLRSSCKGARELEEKRDIVFTQGTSVFEEETIILLLLS